VVTEFYLNDGMNQIVKIGTLTATTQFVVLKRKDVETGLSELVRTGFVSMMLLRRDSARTVTSPHKNQKNPVLTGTCIEHTRYLLSF
jgi:hypothetical protein